MAEVSLLTSVHFTVLHIWFIIYYKEISSYCDYQETEHGYSNFTNTYWLCFWILWFRTINGLYMYTYLTVDIFMRILLSWKLMHYQLDYKSYSAAVDQKFFYKKKKIVYFLAEPCIKTSFKDFTTFFRKLVQLQL